MQRFAVTQIVYTTWRTHCAVDFGHSVGKCKCIFICIFICLTNLWPTLKCALSLALSSLPSSSRSLAHSLHCHGTPTHPLSLILLVALCAQV